MCIYFLYYARTYLYVNKIVAFLQMALQTAGIVSGLPYAFIIFIFCQSVWREVQLAAGDLDSSGPGTDVMIFKIFLLKNFAKILAFFVQTTASF
jgi:choline-glycine betaine transporter